MAGTVTYLIITRLPFTSWIRLFIGVPVFLLAFILVALFTQTITKSEIINLRAMTTGFGIFTGIINKFLNLLKKLIANFKL